MPHFASVIAKETVESRCASKYFQTGHAMCIKQYPIDEIVVGRFGGTIYRGIIHQGFLLVRLLLMSLALARPPARKLVSL